MSSASEFVSESIDTEWTVLLAGRRSRDDDSVSVEDSDSRLWMGVSDWCATTTADDDDNDEDDSDDDDDDDDDRRAFSRIV